MKKTINELKAGIFIVAGLTFFAVIVFIMGSERQIFASQEEFHTTFTDVKGLAEGAPVRLGGISVGRVAKIAFAKDPADPTIHVKLLVNSNFLDRIHPDSVVGIQTQGLLGDKFLNVTAGKDVSAAPPGSLIRSEEVPEMDAVLSKATIVIENTVEVSKSIREFTEKLKSESLPDFLKATRSIANLTEAVDKGDGFLHRMIYSKKDGDNVINSFSTASAQLSDLIGEIKNGKGFLHSLIYQPVGDDTASPFMKAAENISVTASGVNELIAQIKSGNGLVHDLIYGKSDQGLSSAIDKLNQTAENLRKASEALSQGTGTIGALLLDPQIYDNLVEVTDGAKRSYLLRQAIKSTLNQ